MPFKNVGTLALPRKLQGPYSFFGLQIRFLFLKRHIFIVKKIKVNPFPTYLMLYPRLIKWLP